MSPSPSLRHPAPPTEPASYTFTHAVPANATGTYAIGIEGRISITLLPGTTAQMTTNYGGVNQVIYFSVDGSPVTPRRTVVALANCNACHANLEVHGSLRNNTAYCVLCHNPSNTDASTRPAHCRVQQIAAARNQLRHDDSQDPHRREPGDLRRDLHDRRFRRQRQRFHHGVFPAMGPTGAVQDTAECYMCHASGSEAVLPIGKNAVTDPQGLLNPSPATTSACTACHLNQSALAHCAIQHRPEIWRKLRRVPRHRRAIQRHPGARGPVES